MNCFRNLWTGKSPLNVNDISMNSNTRAQIIQRPDDTYKFLHDCMIISYHEKLYAAWYNCPVHEMADKSVIRGRISCDNGETWSDVITMAEDLSGKYIYVPPAFGICPADDRLYLFATRMTGCDLVHDFEIFCLNEQKNLWKHAKNTAFFAYNLAKNNDSLAEKYNAERSYVLDVMFWMYFEKERRL